MKELILEIKVVICPLSHKIKSLSISQFYKRKQQNRGNKKNYMAKV